MLASAVARPAHRRHGGLRVRRLPCSPLGAVVTAVARTPGAAALVIAPRRVARHARVASRLVALGCERAPRAACGDGAPARGRELLSALGVLRARWRATAPRSSRSCRRASSPTTGSPRPRTWSQVRKARLFVYNGAGFEPGADRLLKEIAGSGALPVNTHRADSRWPHGDPHVWLDPVLAQAQVDAIRAGARAGGSGRREPALRRARRRLQGQARGAPRRRSRPGSASARAARRGASHAAFAYLARRYRLNQVPVTRARARVRAEPRRAGPPRALRPQGRTRGTSSSRPW